MAERLLMIEDDRSLAEMVAEYLRAANMEVQIQADGNAGLELLRRRPGWGSLKAVKAGRVIDSIHPDLISRPGPRLVKGMEALARALHPDAFR